MEILRPVVVSVCKQWEEAYTDQAKAMNSKPAKDFLERLGGILDFKKQFIALYQTDFKRTISELFIDEVKHISMFERSFPRIKIFDYILEKITENIIESDLPSEIELYRKAKILEV